MPCGWEGNRRSGMRLSMHHRHQWFIHLQGLSGVVVEISKHPAYPLLGTCSCIINILCYATALWVWNGWALFVVICNLPGLHSLVCWALKNAILSITPVCHKHESVIQFCKGFMYCAYVSTGGSSTSIAPCDRVDWKLKLGKQGGGRAFFSYLGKAPRLDCSMQGGTLWAWSKHCICSPDATATHCLLLQ